MSLDTPETVSVAYLSEMLEGQVAVLSSGYLETKESLGVLDAMKKVHYLDQTSILIFYILTNHYLVLQIKIPYLCLL